MWVSPFGNLRVKGCSHLTAAYRSVPRPSSPVYAKASTNCPYLTLENPHHHRQSCLHDRRRYPVVWFLLDRTDSTFVRTTQLDNHLCVSSWPNASAATLARTAALFIHAVTASISRTHSQCQRRGLTPLTASELAELVSSSLEKILAATRRRPGDGGGGAYRDRT